MHGNVDYPAPRGIKFSVAANYDSELIPALSSYPVDEVYGKLPDDGMNAGRARYQAGSLSEKAFKTYVQVLDTHGIAFNYLLNGSCFGNSEWSRRWQKNANALLEKLITAGVKRVTVSTPFLLELVKTRFPQLKAKVGIYAQVDSVKRAQFWVDSGADAITLESFSINRDFKRLFEIRKAVKCDLQLIANHVCMPNCALQPYHQNGFAHASGEPGKLFIDYCLFRCSRERMMDTSLFIKAGWIRPEDIDAYAAIGYSTFKLLERDIPSSEILRRVHAYSIRHFDGNLAEILLPYGFKETRPKGLIWAARNFWRPHQANTRKMKPFFELAKLQGMLSASVDMPVRIDSHKIPPGFLRGFQQKDCSSLDCRQCGYCSAIAADAVSVDPGFKKEVLRLHAEANASMAEGGLWNG